MTGGGTRRRAVALLAAVALSPLALPAVARADAQADAEACRPLKAAVTLDALTVAGRKIATSGTWTAAPGTPGVLLEVREDGDAWATYTELGASGVWSWEGLQPIGSRMCGHHTLHVYARPLVERGKELVHCLGQGADAQRPLFIDCMSRAVIESCSWSCLPAEGTAAPACQGSCVGSATGLSGTYVPQWSVDGTAMPAPPDLAASAGPWTQELRCRAGQKIDFAVRGYGGLERRAAGASTVCGAPPQAAPQP